MDIYLHTRTYIRTYLGAHKQRHISNSRCVLCRTKNPNQRCIPEMISMGLNFIHVLDGILKSKSQKGQLKFGWCPPRAVLNMILVLHTVLKTYWLRFYGGHESPYSKRWRIQELAENKAENKIRTGPHKKHQATNFSSSKLQPLTHLRTPRDGRRYSPKGAQLNMIKALSFFIFRTMLYLLLLMFERLLH